MLLPAKMASAVTHEGLSRRRRRENFSIPKRGIENRAGTAKCTGGGEESTFDEAMCELNSKTILGRH
jgi:hypothetical protein